MLKRYCDRCGKEIKGDPYRITYSCETSGGIVSAEGAALNLREFSDKMHGRRRDYCSGCLYAVKKYAEKSEDKKNET